LAKRAEKDTGKKNKKLRKIAEYDQEISVDRNRNHEDADGSESDEDDVVPTQAEA
jgi:hypothetical protein